MQIKKWIATGLSALMAGATFAGAAVAAADLSGFPSNLASTTATSSSLDAFVVVGDKAAAQDVAGAVDVASRLSELSYTLVSTTSGSSGITGIEKDGVGLGVAANGDALTTGDNAFPATTMKNSHFSSLWTGQISWNSSSYNAHEEVDISGVRMRHDFATDKINGTEKMEIQTSGDVIAKYVFDTNITNVGTVSSPQYTKPVKITFLGKEFQIVGVSASSIKLLSGSIGTAVKEGTTSTGVTTTDGKYTAYVTAGSNNDWSTIQIKDAQGAVVDTVSNAKEGDVKSSTAAGLDVKVTDIRVSGTDPATQHIEVDLVLGATGSTEQEYDASADTSSTSKEKFTGTSDWFITYTAGSNAEANTITSGTTVSSLNAEYRPSDTQYLKSGEKLSLPNNYAELGFSGYNTDNYNTITVKAVGSVSVVNSTGSSLSGSSLYGLEIAADGTNKAIGSGWMPTPNWYNAMYILFNASVFNNTPAVLTNTTYTPVFLGYKNSAGKIQINDTIFDQAKNGLVIRYAGQIFNNTPMETPWGVLMDAGGQATAATNSSSIFLPIKLRYNGAGDSTYWLNATVEMGDAGRLGLVRLPVGRTTLTTKTVFTNKTTFGSTANANNLASDLLRLGVTASSAEDDEINVTTEGTAAQKIGKASQDILDDSGVWFVKPTDGGSGDKVVIKIPSKNLQAKVYFGKSGAAAVSAGTNKVVSPIKTAVAKLSSETTGTTKTSKHLVLVGGPCANSLVQELVDAGALNKTYTCKGGTPGSSWAKDTAFLLLTEGKFATGKIALVVAGTDAKDTRLATSVLQNYDHARVKGKLTGTAVKLTGTSVEDVTIATASV